METYLREVNATPPLSAEEEKRLAHRVRQGDPEARDHLVRAHLRLVVTIARGYPARGLSLHDLVAEGNLGLLRAAEGFDPSMDARFSTYASFWIKQSIRAALVRTATTIRLPAYTAKLLSEWRRAAAGLADELGRPPTEEEVAGRLKLSRKKLGILQKAMRVDQGMCRGGQAGADLPLSERLHDHGARAPDATLAAAEGVREVLGLVDRLHPREATVLRLRFGLAGEGPLTLRQVGDRVGLTRERVRQIESEALKKLNEAMHPG
jgi:RNA polymerase primary sigma factor